MALAFWVEAIPTYDLDVLIALPPSRSIPISLAPIYAWARDRGLGTESEHIIIGGVPVQFLPAHSELASEAIATAANLKYGSVDARVVRPEYLIALYLDGSAKTAQRRQRAAILRESGDVDEQRLQDLLHRFKLTFE